MLSEEKSCLQDRYLLQTRLGANGLRETWKAIDQETQKPVIVKMLFFNGEAAWKEHELFERQAKTLQSLNHPRIPKYQDSFWAQNERTLCLIQEYIPGQSLDEIDVPLRVEKVLDIAEQVLEILIYLHGLSPPVLHRDIKPSNLILGEDQKIYLIDFGSVQAELNVGHTLTVVGTYGYMAPEQFGGQPLPASDLYGLGATLLYLLTGTDPAELSRGEPQLQIDRKIVSQEITKRWLNSFISPSINQRFASAKNALQELREFSKVCDKLASAKKTSNVKSITRTDQNLVISLSGLEKKKAWSLLLITVLVWTFMEAIIFILIGKSVILVSNTVVGVTSLWRAIRNEMNGVKLTIRKEKLQVEYLIGNISFWKTEFDLTQPTVIQTNASSNHPYPKTFTFLQENNKKLVVPHRLEEAEAKFIAEEIRFWLKNQTRQ